MTRGPVEMAPLTAALMPELTDLWVGAWTQAMPQIDFEARRPWLKAHLEGLRQQAYVTLCALEATGALAGFVTMQPRSGELDQIAVAPWAARRGLARFIGGLLRERPIRAAWFGPAWFGAAWFRPWRIGVGRGAPGIGGENASTGLGEAGVRWIESHRGGLLLECPTQTGWA
jgi:hypothetical protein